MVATQIFFFHPGEMIQFDEHIFQMGWFNHQPVYIQKIFTKSDVVFFFSMFSFEFRIMFWRGCVDVFVDMFLNVVGLIL